jgi:putative PIG3 family NAD(P)H quinone oxidoreductase
LKAIVIKQPGGPEVLQIEELKKPEPGYSDVQVRVQAAGLNQADISQRQGRYPAPADCPQDIPGLEFSGTVEKLGANVHNFSIGDRVFGLVGGGAYAEYLVTNSRLLAKLPERLSFVEGAAIPEAFITAYDAMVSQANLSCGEIVLINAVGSGVGIAAVQIAKAIGATTIGTARTPEKLEKAKAYGLDFGVVAQEGYFAEEIKKISEGVDVILELVGGNYLPEDLICASLKARIVLIGMLAGRSMSLDLSKVLTKKLKIIGTTLRARPLEEKIIVTNVFKKHLLPLFEKGVLRPVVDEIFPLAKAADAHSYLETHKTFGKVVLTI